MINNLNKITRVYFTFIAIICYVFVASFFDPSLKEMEKCIITEGKKDVGDGWKNIYVYYGNHLSNPRGDSFSQVYQDKAVLSLLNQKHGGYFVDLAANHAHGLSNSYLLEEYYNWSGLCIEPNSIYWESLSTRKCQVVASAVGGKSFGSVEFRVDNGPLGGIVNEKFDNKPANETTKILKQMVPLESIFKTFRVPRQIDYLSFDVEGAEEYIFADFPFNDYFFNILTIERPNDSLKSILFSNNYTLLLQITPWGETIWIRNDLMKGMNITKIFDIYERNYSGYVF
jgi:Methyltransferase FkbM domain